MHSNLAPWMRSSHAFCLAVRRPSGEPVSARPARHTVKPKARQINSSLHSLVIVTLNLTDAPSMNTKPRPNQGRVVVVSGAPGSGKTTLAAYLSRALGGAALIDKDTQAGGPTRQHIAIAGRQAA
jgi:polynucleotide 5'-kinase involved in rRNA processing